MSEALAKEYVEFIAKGLDQVEASAKKLVEGMSKAGQQARELKEALANVSPAGFMDMSQMRGYTLAGVTPDLRAVDEAAKALGHHLEKTASEAVALREALGNGEYSRIARDLAGVNREMLQLAKAGQVETLAAQAKELQGSLASGVYGEFAAKMAASDKELAAVGKQMVQLKAAAHWEDLVTQHSRFQAAMLIGNEKLQLFKEKLEGIGRTAGWAFAGLTGGILGWVTAGLQGTAQGELLSRSLQELSRQIAGVFQPVVQKLTDWIRSLTSWFRSLSGAQQDSILRWSLVAVGVTGVLLVIPKLVAGYQALTTAVIALDAAIVKMNLAVTGSNAGLGSLLTKLGGARLGIGALAVSGIAAPHPANPEVEEMTRGKTKEQIMEMSRQLRAQEGWFENTASSLTDLLGGIASLGGILERQEHRTLSWQLEDAAKKRDDRRDLSLAGGGFEAVDASFKRLQGTSLKTETDDIPKQQLTELQQIRQELQKAPRGGVLNNALIDNFLGP